jgi:hypothetical protein
VNFSLLIQFRSAKIEEFQGIYIPIDPKDIEMQLLATEILFRVLSKLETLKKEQMKLLKLHPNFLNIDGARFSEVLFLQFMKLDCKGVLVIGESIFE